MIDIGNLLGAGAGLIDASFRGVPFSMPNASSETGRRVQRVFFPGRDDTAFQDLGAFDGPIRVSGLVTGDDYVNQATALQAAFRTPGPGLLVHPWLGQILVVLTDPVQISFTWTELRVARFQATFAPYYPPTPPVADTLSVVTSSIEDVQDAAGDLLAAILAPAVLTLALVGAVQNFCGVVAGVWDDVAGAAGAMATAVAADVAALGTVNEFVADITYAATVAAALAAPAADLVTASSTLLPSAIGPGDIVPATTPLDAAVTTAALLAAQTQILATATATGAVVGLVLAAAAQVTACAVDAAGDIAFTSQQDAQAWLTQLQAAIDACATLATTIAPAQPVAAGTVWRNLQALRGAVSADINAQIGRLPIVETLTINSMPVWLIAQSLSGDTPANVLATYTDLVARNSLANPALVPPGTIEALVA